MNLFPTMTTFTILPQPVPVDLKSFYLSDKKPDKMLQEGIFTIFNEIDEMKSELKAMLKPNGSQQAPARSCYDLFLCNPSFEAGKLHCVLCIVSFLTVCNYQVFLNKSSE